MTKGSRIEMGMRILGFVKDAADLGQIAHASGMSRTEVEQYLTFFVGSGSVLYDESTELYRLAPKGRSIIAEYDRLNKLLESNESHIETTGRVNHGARLMLLP
jgi:DNA-binding IclR family transcriptional regulator